MWPVPIVAVREVLLGVYRCQDSGVMSEKPALTVNLKVLAVGYVALTVALTVLLLVVLSGAAERTGLRVQVYSGPTWDGEPIVERIAPEVTLGFLDADRDLPRRLFSARWHGFWHVPDAGQYVLRGAGDDHLDVWIDGELLIRRRQPADMHEAAREIWLDAGPHELLVEYAQVRGDYNMRLEWHLFGSRPRIFAGHMLFQEPPGPSDIRAAWLVLWLTRLVAVVWAVLLLFAAALLTSRYRLIFSRIRPERNFSPNWHAVVRGALVLALVAVVVRAVEARLPGLDPESLWYDDLLIAATVRADLWNMLTVPLHVSPGLLIIWRGLYAMLPDPEWSLQLLPFACGIAAIPLMALVVRALTRDDTLAVLAGAVTALNPLLAHYTVFVHQYAVEFTITALFLLAATRLYSGRASDLDSRCFAGVALAGGLAPFFSVTSVFTSFPLVNLAAVYAVRDWFRNGKRSPAILWSAAAYNAMVFIAYLLLQGRSSPAMRTWFASEFMPIDSTGEALAFLLDNGQRLVGISLPGWIAGWWPLLGLGLVWLLSRRPTRFLGLVILGFYSARVLASALWIYPLGTNRLDVFTLPVAICIFVAGIQAATAAFSKPALPRLLATVVVVWFAVVRPVNARYFNTADSPLVDYLSAAARVEDAVVLSEGATYLTAFYGSWPVVLTAQASASHGNAVKLVRDRTLHLPMSGPSRQARSVTQFLNVVGPNRIWYVAYRTRGRQDAVIAAIRGAGYRTHEVLRSQRGRLHLGLPLDRARSDLE